MTVHFHLDPPAPWGPLQVPTTRLRGPPSPSVLTFHCPQPSHFSGAITESQRGSQRAPHPANSRECRNAGRGRRHPCSKMQVISGSHPSPPWVSLGSAPLHLRFGPRPEEGTLFRSLPWKWGESRNKTMCQLLKLPLRTGLCSFLSRSWAQASHTAK